MRIKSLFHWMLCWGLLTLQTSTMAQDFQSHESIHDAAGNHIMENISALYDDTPEIKPGQLDSRLRLTKCGTALETFLPRGGRMLGNITVGVKCTAPKPWSLYVPLSVTVYQTVLVTNKPLARGALLSNEDLKLAKHDLSRLSNGYYSEPSQLSGMKLKRAVQAGMPLTSAIIEKPLVIRRGQRIILLAKSNNVEVRMSGKALMNGVSGERIQVQNLTSKQTLEGIVASPGVVKISI